MSHSTFDACVVLSLRIFSRYLKKKIPLTEDRLRIKFNLARLCSSVLRERACQVRKDTATHCNSLVIFWSLRQLTLSVRMRRNNTLACDATLLPKVVREELVESHGVGCFDLRLLLQRLPRFRSELRKSLLVRRIQLQEI